MHAPKLDCEVPNYMTLKKNLSKFCGLHKTNQRQTRYNRTSDKNHPGLETTLLLQVIQTLQNIGDISLCSIIISLHTGWCDFMKSSFFTEPAHKFKRCRLRKTYKRCLWTFCGKFHYFWDILSIDSRISLHFFYLAINFVCSIWMIKIKIESFW